MKPARGSPLAMVRDMFRLAMIHGYGAVSSSTRWTPTATCSAGGWTGLHCLDDVSQQRARRACALTMSCDRPLSWRTEALDAALRTAGDTRQKQVASHGACAVTSTWGGPGGVLRLRRGRPPHEGGARRTSTREEDEQGAPFLMRLYMLVNLSRSSWIQRLLSLGRYLIRRPRSGSARLSRSRRHAPVRHRQTTATTPASSCPLYSLSHPALRQCKTTMAAGARGVVRGGPAAYIRVSLSELENKHLGDGHLIVHDVLQAEARRRFVEIGGAANRVHLRGSRRRSRRQRAAARAGRSARLDGVPRLKHHTVD